jgi:hypothetical protein
MPSFPTSDAAFTGFRVVRERPTTVLFLAVIQVIYSLGQSLLMISLAGPTLTQMQNLGIAAALDPAQSARFLPHLVPMYLALVPLNLVVYALFCAAMNRAVLRPAESQFGYLRFGADEARQLGLLALMFLLFFGVYIAATIAAVVIGFVVGLVLAMILGAAAAGVIMTMVAIIGALAAMAFLGVRLSLASAQTFATKRINVFGSWALTKDRFWPLLGTYLLTACLLAMMGLLATVITGSIALITVSGMRTASTAIPPGVISIGAYFTPAHIFITVLSALFSALFLPVFLTPPAAIYQSLTAPFGTGAGGKPTTVDSIFS